MSAVATVPREGSHAPQIAAPDREGWLPFATRGPFSTLIGPFYHRTSSAGLVEHGFRIEARHCNSYGILHGGMVLGFADGMFAHAAVRALGARCVTVRLSGDNLDMAREGDWVSGMAVPLAPPEDGLISLDGTISCRDRVIWRGMATFKAMGARRIR